MNKRFFQFVFILSGLCVLCGESFAQNVARRQTVGAAGRYQITSLVGTGVTAHNLSWTITGTVSACTIKLSQAETLPNWSDLTSTYSCTSAGLSTIVTSVANNVSVQVITFTGSGRVNFIYQGWLVSPGLISSMSSPLTTKGDLFGFSTLGARVPVGADGDFLKADSTNPLGVSYDSIPATTPGGADTNVQFNNAGAFGGDAAFTWTAGTLMLLATNINGATSIQSPLFRSAAADVADAGELRLGNNQQICFEANPTGTDFCITGNTSNVVLFSGGVEIDGALRQDGAANFNSTTDFNADAEFNSTVDFGSGELDSNIPLSEDDSWAIGNSTKALNAAYINELYPGTSATSQIIGDTSAQIILQPTTKTTNEGNFESDSYNTENNCADSAGAAACGAAPAGAFVIDAGSNSTVVSTTAVTADSQVFLQIDASLGARLGITCNTGTGLALGAPRVTARTAATSFTATIDIVGGPVANPLCMNYWIVN